MKQHRFIVQTNLDEPTIIIAGEVAHQMKKVLHLQIGETVVVSNGQGKEVVAKF